MLLRFLIPEPYKKDFEVQVRVTVEGVFTCTMPRKIAPLFEKAGLELSINRAGNTGYFISDTLEGLKKKIKAKIEELCSEEEESRKRIIRYTINTKCTYSKTPDGDFAPNCAFAEGAEDWSNGTADLDSRRRKPFGFEIYAKPYEKVIYRFKATGKKRVDYESLHVHKFHGDMKDPIDWLVNLCGQEEPEEDPGVEMYEIDYTEEAAWFFVKLYKAIFTLNEQIKPFIKPKEIQKLIARGNLLGAPAQKEVDWMK